MDTDKKIFGKVSNPTYLDEFQDSGVNRLMIIMYSS